ncbi:DUF6193 family natural product biosynthesis protein [Streptomyces sp. NPDC005808]|uniref:DUF6193 family natural product biosynthesis protein n=1 Tax=Streptomyces sp. NPDC005808 TaxID=3364734 RepID=UPI0036D06E5E
MAAARSRGPADVVEAHWQALRLSWQWKPAVHQLRTPRRPYPGIVPLLKAAAAQPRLRRLSPFTSHFALLFSRSTSYPWTVQAGPIEPLDNERFKVRRRVRCRDSGVGARPAVPAAPGRHRARRAAQRRCAPGHATSLRA